VFNIFCPSWCFVYSGNLIVNSPARVLGKLRIIGERELSDSMLWNGRNGSWEYEAIEFI